MQAAIYREKDVLALVGVSKATLWRWRRDGAFPNPVQLGPNTVGWHREDVDDWLASRPLATGQSESPPALSA